MAPLLPAPQPPHPFFDHAGVLAMAHRGFAPDGVENSMRAFEAAVRLGFRYVETDVHATADDVVVALHDATLDRVTDRSGDVAQLSWAQVRQARIGGTEPVPSLEELLGTWPELRVNIDVKSVAAIAPTVRAIERTRAHHRVCLASFSDARRRATVRRLSRAVATSGGRGLAARFYLASGARLAGQLGRWLGEVHCWQLPVRYGGVPVVTRRLVADAHAGGRQVHVWTVNEADQMRSVLDIGVDGIVTDRADVLRAVLLSRGLWAG